MADMVREHQAQTEQLRAAQATFLSSLDGYEKKKVEYQIAVATQLQLTHGDEAVAQRVLELSQKGGKAASDLIQAVKQLHEALVKRAEAFRAQAGVEAGLIDVEARSFGSREAAAQRSAAAVQALHDADAKLREAQKAQQEALAAFNRKEAELWTLLADDTKVRDLAGDALEGMRLRLDAAFATLLERAQQLDESYDRLHRDMQKPIEEKDAALGAKHKELVAERERASRELAGARQYLKVATLYRAEKRAQEVANDVEMAGLVAGAAFKKEKDKKAFRQSIKAPWDAQLAAREKMFADDRALVEVRKKLVSLEAKIAALGY